MSPAPTAFWVDRDYDRAHASDGISRYGAYLRDATFEPWTDHDQAVEWAVFAWRRATGPVMSPGYVRYHPRVLAARLERSGWDGSLVAGVSLVSSWPEQLKTPLASGAEAWRPGCVLAGLAHRIPRRRDRQLLRAQRSGCRCPAVPAGHRQLAVHRAVGRAPGATRHVGCLAERRAASRGRGGGRTQPDRRPGPRRRPWPHVPRGGEGLVMAAELALAADPGIDRAFRGPGGVCGAGV